MNTLKIHSSGKTDFLKVLKNKYEALKQTVFRNKQLTDSERKEKLEELQKSFKEEKRNSNKNLY